MKELEITYKREIVSAVLNPFTQFSTMDYKLLFQFNSTGLKHRIENSSKLLFPRAAKFNFSLDSRQIQVICALLGHEQKTFLLGMNKKKLKIVCLHS